jgi:hypothetical protein
MSDSEEKKYLEMTFSTAKKLWGEEVIKIKEHIEITSKAVYRVNQFELTSDIEPVIKLRHDE